MTKTLAAPHAARLTELVAHRRGDGSRGLRARRAWQRLVRACAAGDPAALDAARSVGLPEADVLDLLHVAPAEPADRAAYLALLGQTAQRRALDPDGSLLTLAYRAAAPEVCDVGHPSYQGAFDRIQTLAAGNHGDAAIRKAFERLREHPLDLHFASELYAWGDASQDPTPIAVSAYGDMVVTSAHAHGEPGSSAPGGLEVYSPHVPSARALLELRPKIGDPAVREALDLLARALEDRFGGDIALGTDPVSPGGPHDIALGAEGTE